MKVTIVQFPEGDWEALYVDGKLVAGDNMLSAEQILRHLTKVLSYEFRTINDVNFEPCSLPEKLMGLSK